MHWCFKYGAIISQALLLYFMVGNATFSPINMPSISPSNTPSALPTNKFYESIEVTDLDSTKQMPRRDSNMAAGYDLNETILLIGGTTENKQLVFFNIITNTFTDYSRYFLSVGGYGISQFYTQINNILYMIRYTLTDGNSFITVDTQTKAVNYTSIIIPNPVHQSGCLASITYNNTHQYLLVLGGKNATQSYPQQTLRLLQIYNLSSHEWLNDNNNNNKSIPSLRVSRMNFACIVHKNILYAVGGYNTDEYLNTVESLYVGNDLVNIEAQQWEYMIDTLSHPTRSCKVVSYADNIFVLGGQWSNLTFSTSIHIIDTVANTIKIGGILAKPLAATAAVMVNGIVYLFGGQRIEGLVQTYQYFRVEETNAPTAAPSIAPSNSPSTAPSNAPSNAPTTAPTHSPTRFPTVLDGYDSYIDVGYAMYALTLNNVLTILNNVSNIVSDIAIFIEEGYIHEMNIILEYRQFGVKILDINDVSINDTYAVSVSHSSNELFEMYKNTYLTAIIQCNEAECNHIKNNYKNQTFVHFVTQKLQNYFDNNTLLNFSVTSMSSTKSLHPSNTTNSNDVIVYYTIILSLLICAIICAALIFCKYRMKLKKEKLKRTKNATDIYNPMVISIGIQEYQQCPTNPGVDVYCKDLYGIDRDYDNVQQFCTLFKYDFYSKEDKFDWTQHEIVQFLNKCAQIVCDSINKVKYDCILVILSGHGYQNSIISSDYQMINKTAIHRIFSTNFALLRDIPRIFVFDCCDGSESRSYRPGIDENTLETEKGKCFDTTDIELTKQTSIWKLDQKNPDYKLALIHAANEGFQAKIDSVSGSFLITELMKRLMENIEQKNGLFFGEIIDGIQQHLHDLGKQQIQSVFNNQTRFLRFNINVNGDAGIELMESARRTISNDHVQCEL